MLNFVLLVPIKIAPGGHSNVKPVTVTVTSAPGGPEDGLTEMLAEKVEGVRTTRVKRRIRRTVMTLQTLNTFPKLPLNSFIFISPFLYFVFRAQGMPSPLGLNSKNFFKG
jgi:hypothetical protein